MMKTQKLLFALMLTPFITLAQSEEWKEASKESQAYHEFRLKNTIPPYGLSKVKQLLAKADADEVGGKAIVQKEYNALTLREKFTYNMIHAESYSQNCDVMPPVQEEQTKISGQLPDAFSEESWSDRQLEFFRLHKDSVLALIKESANRSGRMGLNYKQAVVEVNGVDFIPFIIETYKRNPKDLDLLTLLMLLMKNNKYPPFISSVSYTKLYGKTSDYQSHIQFNKANEELILKRAADFYNSKH